MKYLSAAQKIAVRKGWIKTYEDRMAQQLANSPTKLNKLKVEMHRQQIASWKRSIKNLEAKRDSLKRTKQIVRKADKYFGAGVIFSKTKATVPQRLLFAKWALDNGLGGAELYHVLKVDHSTLPKLRSMYDPKTMRTDYVNFKNYMNESASV